MFDQKLEETLEVPSQGAPSQGAPSQGVATEITSEQPEAQPAEGNAEESQGVSPGGTQKEQVPNKQESDRDRNFAALRDKVARIERERDEMAARAKQTAQQQPEEEDDIGIGDDDLAEGRHLKKQSRELRKMKNELAEAKRVMYEQTVEARLKANHPDFDKVVNQETLSVLRENYPDIAQTLNSSTDLYSKASAAYTMVKKLGLYTPDHYEKERAQAANNAVKPRSTASVSPQQGESPLSNANAFSQGLTPELKKKLYAEMLEAKKGY